MTNAKYAINDVVKIPANENLGIREIAVYGTVNNIIKAHEGFIYDVVVMPHYLLKSIPEKDIQCTMQEN